jgi:hypothetical protein
MHKAFESFFAIKWEVNVQTYKQRNLKKSVLPDRMSCCGQMLQPENKIVRYWMSDNIKKLPIK